jgi:inhibitor of KinA sporulation pathway (predicted exonuclease)
VFNLQRPIVAIVDFEATCGNVPNSEVEIIAWGCVLLETSDFSLLHSKQKGFRTFIRPQIHPIMSQFCLDLTGVSQQEVSWGQSFKCGFEEFLEWIKPYGSFEDFTFGAWGEFDKKQLEIQCRIDGQEVPFSDWCNLRTEVMRELGIGKNSKSSVRSVVEGLGGHFEGREHCAYSDCLTVAQILNLANKKVGELKRIG